MPRSTDAFSPDYFTARDRFIEQATAAGGRLEAISLSARGPKGQILGIDVAWFGVPEPRRALLHSSGLHGVEGFAGAAIQLELLRNLPAVPRDAALVLVHILNPYGMAWLRRVNENNVDLNRNCLAEEQYSGAPDKYHKLHSFLNPASSPRADLFTARALWLVLRYGLPALKLAVVAGQYEHPKGLFFGGKQEEEGTRKYRKFIAERLAAVRHMLTVDVHTGIGKYGEDLLMSSPEYYQRVRAMYGARAAPPDPYKSASYPVRGALDGLYSRALPAAQVFPIVQEFGTYNPVKVLHALREENRWHHYGTATLDHPSKQRLKRTFCPDDQTWRAGVLARGKALFDQALASL